jgi:iron(III) transport system substrate-binding protein
MRSHVRLFVTVLFVSAVFVVGLAGFSPARANELNIYSYRQEFLTKPFIERFEQETGVTVNTVFIKKGMLERLKAEGMSSPADLVMTADIARLQALADAGLLQPVRSADLDRNIPTQYHGPDGLWYGLTTRARVFYYAKERVDPAELSTYENLTYPKWRGRLCTRSGYHIYQLSLLASMIVHHGATVAEEWLEGVKRNLARKPQGNDRAQVKAIKEGVCDLALGNTYYMGQMKANPEQRPWADAVSIFFPNQESRGTHVNISGIAVAKSAKNLSNATRFVEFLSSDAAQEMYARQSFEYPVKEGVAWHPEVESWGRFKADDMNLVEIAYHLTTAVKIVDRVAYD